MIHPVDSAIQLLNSWGQGETSNTSLKWEIITKYLSD